VLPSWLGGELTRMLHSVTRLLNIPVPTIYFNTADNPAFVFE